MKSPITHQIDLLRRRALPLAQEEALVRELLDLEGGDDALFAEDPTLQALSLAVPAAAPPADGRRRLLDAARRTSRFAPLRALVSRLLTISESVAADLLDAIDRATSWAASPWVGVTVFHLEERLPGTGLPTQAVVGFVRVSPGAPFPHHGHIGDEHVLVVQGGLVDSSGAVLRAGDLVVAPAGSAHSFVALPGADLVYLVVAYGGVQVGELLMSPGHPDV